MIKSINRQSFLKCELNRCKQNIVHESGRGGQPMRLMAVEMEAPIEGAPCGAVTNSKLQANLTTS